MSTNVLETAHGYVLTWINYYISLRREILELEAIVLGT